MSFLAVVFPPFMTYSLLISQNGLPGATRGERDLLSLLSHCSPTSRDLFPL
jgi:hypothetical protein